MDRPGGAVTDKDILIVLAYGVIEAEASGTVDLAEVHSRLTQEAQELIDNQRWAKLVGDLRDRLDCISAAVQKHCRTKLSSTKRLALVTTKPSAQTSTRISSGTKWGDRHNLIGSALALISCVKPGAITLAEVRSRVGVGMDGRTQFPETRWASLRKEMARSAQPLVPGARAFLLKGEQYFLVSID